MDGGRFPPGSGRRGSRAVRRGSRQPRRRRAAAGPSGSRTRPDTAAGDGGLRGLRGPGRVRVGGSGCGQPGLGGAGRLGPRAGHDPHRRPRVHLVYLPARPAGAVGVHRSVRGSVAPAGPAAGGPPPGRRSRREPRVAGHRPAGCRRAAGHLQSVAAVPVAADLAPGQATGQGEGMGAWYTMSVSGAVDRLPLP
jgi:hypothetical protein